MSRPSRGHVGVTHRLGPLAASDLVVSCRCRRGLPCFSSHLRAHSSKWRRVGEAVICVVFSAASAEATGNDNCENIVGRKQEQIHSFFFVTISSARFDRRLEPQRNRKRHNQRLDRAFLSAWGTELFSEVISITVVTSRFPSQFRSLEMKVSVMENIL